MDTMTLVVAGLAAAAIIVIAVGVAMSGSGSGMSERLQRYASTPKPEAAKGGSQGPISDLIAQSQTLAKLNKGRRAARLRREPRARPRARRPAPEAVRVPDDLGRVDRRRPADHGGPLGRPSDAREPAVPADRRIHRVLHSALLAEPPQGQPPQRVQQAAAGHDHAACQRAAGGFLVPAGDRAGRARVTAADLHRVRAGHPRGQPRPAVRAGDGEHGSSGEVRGPRAHGDRDHDPAPGRRQPRRDPRLDRVHDP